MEAVHKILESDCVVAVKFRSLHVYVYNSKKVMVKKLKKLKPSNICQGILHHAMGNLPNYIVRDILEGWAGFFSFHITKCEYLVNNLSDS